MTRGRKVTLGVLVVVLISVIVVSPLVWLNAYLAWKKHQARQLFAGMSPQDRRGFDLVPTMIVLPEFKSDGQSVEIESLGDYHIRVPHPTTRADEPRRIRLTYPGYQVVLRTPIPLAQLDSLARQDGFKDSFDRTAAVYNQRLSDIDAQRNLPSLQRFVLNFANKPAKASQIEEFVRPDLRGFVLGGVADDKMTPVDVDLQQDRAGAGVWFINTGGLTLKDIHEFLTVLHYEQSH